MRPTAPWLLVYLGQLILNELDVKVCILSSFGGGGFRFDRRALLSSSTTIRRDRSYPNHLATFFTSIWMGAVLQSGRRSLCALAVTANWLLSVGRFRTLVLGSPAHIAEVPVLTASAGRSIRSADGRVPNLVFCRLRGLSGVSGRDGFNCCEGEDGVARVA